MTKVVLLMKSGNKVELEGEDLEVSTSRIGSDLTKMNWSGNENIKPLFIDLDSVEAVYEVLKSNV